MSQVLNKNRIPLVAPGLSLLMILFLIPILGIIAVSFLTTENFQIVFNPNLSNYLRIAQPLYLDVIVRTVRIALIVSAISLLVGFPVAYFIAMKVRKRQALLLILIVTPLWTSYLVRTFAWMQILGTNGLINFVLQYTGLTSSPVSWMLYSEFAVIVALVHIYMPFMILPIYAVLDKMDLRLLEAAYDLGAGRLRILLTVILPIAMPGIVTGYIFVFIPAIGAFVTPEILGGTSGLMLGSIIGQQFGASFEYPFGSALSVTLVTIILAITILLLRIGRERGSDA